MAKSYRKLKHLIARVGAANATATWLDMLEYEDRLEEYGKSLDDLNEAYELWHKLTLKLERSVQKLCEENERMKAEIEKLKDGN